ncbi:hypothetical protein ACJMK2_016210 [Sinanodonta woodiana]|uniref:Uncharacterized protein n=1 Tax=Sinanodonta woodiana TaxID=1069815 RepID=A0ABD3USW7_SINWO
MALIKTISILLGITILAVLIMTPSTEGNPIKDCFDTWSRYSQRGYGFIGILWKSCEDLCKCRGHATGACVLVRSKCFLTPFAFLCQCFWNKFWTKTRLVRFLAGSK